MAKMAVNRQPLATWIGYQKWPLETGDFGQNRQRAGDNGENPPGPLETGNFGENGDCSEIGDFGENRHRAGGIQNVANIQIGCPKVAPLKLDN